MQQLPVPEKEKVHSNCHIYCCLRCQKYTADSDTPSPYKKEKKTTHYYDVYVFCEMCTDVITGVTFKVLLKV